MFVVFAAATPVTFTLTLIGNVMFVVFAAATPVMFTFTLISVAKLTFVPLPNMELVDGGSGVLTSV
jgi:hypothetical protein